MERIFYVFGSIMMSSIMNGVKGEVCEHTWNLYEDMCFKYFDESIVQAETREHCNSVGARILTALTPKLKDFLVLHMDGNTNSSYWCVTETGEIDSRLLPKISTASPPVVTSPKTVTPTAKTGKSCYYFQDKALYQGDCDLPRGFICEKDSIIPPVTCPPDTHKIRTHCFWRTNDLLNKTKAAEACSEKGGWLANLETRRKRGYAVVMVALNRKNVWVGASKQEGKIKFNNGEILDTEPQKAYVPTKDEGGDCVILGFSDVSESGTSWIFGDCSRTAYGLCEKDAVLITVTVLPTTSIPTTIPAPRCPGVNANERERNGICYWETTYETPRFDWETSRKYCQSFGGDLASYRDAEEEKMALGGAKGHEGGMWMGLRREPNSNVFRWSDGSTLTYTNWAPGQPKVKGNLNRCVAHTGKNSTWEGTYCGVPRYFLCKIPKDKVISSPVTPTLAPVPACTRYKSSPQIAWNYHQGYCYAFYKLRKFSWEAAKTFCRDNGAFLASIHSFDDINFLLRLSPNYSGKRNFWIGLRAKGLHSSYRWDDGTPVDFVNWEEDDPYDEASNTDTCVAFEVSTGSWIKTHCNQFEYVICKAQHETNHTFPTPTPTPILPGYCPDEWYTFGNKCYRVLGIKDKCPWSEASRRCAQIGSQLVSIHSKEEDDFLRLLLLVANADTWIGMYSTIGGRLFHWTDNSSIDYTNWNTNEPNYDQGLEECVNLIYAESDEKLGKWNDHRCHMWYPFICQIPKDPMLTKPGQDPFRCSNPEGWLKVGSSCYQIFNESDNRLSWLQAQSFCLSVNGNLATIKNSAASGLLRHHLTGTTGLFWIGMRDTKEKNYQWIGSSTTAGYTNWLKGQPRELSYLHNCVAANSDGKWMVRNCDERHPFICEESKETPTMAPHEPDLICPNITKEWKDYGGKFCYIIEIKKEVTWHQAAYNCFKLGGFLASIHSQYESEAILHVIRDSKVPVYIGLGRKEDGSFGWIDGSAVDYVRWAPGEPNSPNEMCVEMYNDYGGTWNDGTCDTKRGYVCSTKKVPKPGSTTDALKNKGKDVETKLNDGGIVGIIIGVIIVLIIVSVAFYYIQSSKRIRGSLQSEAIEL